MTKNRSGNLLHARAKTPTTAAEIELLLKCVTEAGEKKKKKGQTVFTIAEKLFREAFLKNCALPEEERVELLAPATAKQIQYVFDNMNQAHRERAFRAGAVEAAAGPAAAASVADGVVGPAPTTEGTAAATGACATAPVAAPAPARAAGKAKKTRFEYARPP